MRGATLSARCITAYILQASAHFLQASAHALQQAVSCLPHSAAQASQHFTHKAHKASANCESRAHNLAQRAQMSAQSRQTLTQPSCPVIVQHIVQHFSHSIMQAKHASMQFLEFFILENFKSWNNFHTAKLWGCRRRCVTVLWKRFVRFTVPQYFAVRGLSNFCKTLALNPLPS